MKAIIGISTSGRYENIYQSVYYDHYYIMPDLYVQAVRKAGGIPILLPPGEENLAEILEIVDGIILTGGGDIIPEAYDGNMEHPKVIRLDKERDDFEFAIIRDAVERKDKPVLCVCRGMQVLNVALGGTMYEHIPDIRETDGHRDETGYWKLHEVKVDADSKMAEAMGTDIVHTYSGHHQAVKDIADGLKIVAKSPDDIVEGLELPSHPWMVGVQWHPEKSAHEDKTQQGLFDKLVEIAKVGVANLSVSDVKPV